MGTAYGDNGLDEPVCGRRAPFNKCVKVHPCDGVRVVGLLPEESIGLGGIGGGCLRGLDPIVLSVRY